MKTLINRTHLASRLGPPVLLAFLLACMLPALIVVQRTSRPAQAAHSLDTGSCATAIHLRLHKNSLAGKTLVLGKHGSVCRPVRR